MPLTTAIELIAKIGLPAAHQIMLWVKEGKTEVTEADFSALDRLAQYRSSDALKAAGISIVDGKIVPTA